MPININGFNGRGQSNIEFDFDIGSTIQQFEDNNSVTNNNLLEKDIQILWLILNQSGGERMLNSNDYSMKQLLTDSRPTVFSHQNLVISQASSTDYQSQQINELVASKMKVPLFPIFSKDHNFEQSERISEAQSYQENFSTLQITQEEKLQSILSQSLIIKDSLDLEKPEYVQFYELLSSEIQVVNEGIINQSQSNPISKKKIGVFRFTLAQKNSKQELSLTKQQTINLDNNLNSNWIFRSLNSSQIVALQVIKRAITIDDTYIIGNHIINIKSVEILTPDSCKITLNISRVNNQAAFKKLAV